MLIVTPSISSERAKRYFGESLKRDDYYMRGQEVPGEWFGKGAQQLGLAGQVDQESYFALCDNRNPETGEQLTPRQKTNRRPMYDWTFSAPKAVSVLYEFSGDERIRDAFKQSYRETLVEAEAEMKTRVRKGGKDEDRVTGNMVVAEFTHFTARPVEGQIDPHLHAHCVVFNTTYDPVEERWKASQQGDLKRDADYWEAAFDTRFAKRLNELGYATVKDGTSFTLAELPRSITDKFSLRRDQNRAEAKKRGIVTDKGNHTLGARIRESKQKDVTKDTLRGQWNTRLSDGERAALKTFLAGGSKGDNPVTPEQAIDYSLEHSFQKASAISEKRLRAEALRYGVGSVLPEEVAGLTKNEKVIAKEFRGQVMATTHKTLDNEVEMLQFAQDGQRKFRPLLKANGDSEALAGLSGEQQKAALHVLKSRDQVVGVRGGAGTGKTHMLQTVNAVISSIENGSGDYSRVFAFAQSTTASRGALREVGFKDAETLAMLFKDEAKQARLHKQIVLVDEAGLVSSKDMNRIFAIAKKQQARVVLVGDYRQHASVEAGDAFRLLESEAGVRYAELKEIRRQKDPAYKKAVEEISKGTASGAKKGFDRLDKMGMIVEASGDERHQLLIKDYLQAAEDGKTALIIAPTHAEGERLTEGLRAALKEQGAIGKEHGFMVRRSTGWTDAQKGDGRNFQPGMVVEFNQNVKGFAKGEKAVVIHGGNDVLLQKRDGSQMKLAADADHFDVYRSREIGVGKGDRIRVTKNGSVKVEGQAKGTKISNGDIFTVEGFTKEGDIRLGNGKLLPKDYGHFTSGYVDTSYAAQGKTVKRVFIATGNESLAAANRQQWYVSISRGEELAKVYVDSKQDVKDAIARGTERLSAVELTQTRVKEGWRVRLRKTLERNRVARFLKSRTEAFSDYWTSRIKAERSGYARG
jgi:conjugative relaxase-like TrwC/TraI family protein